MKTIIIITTRDYPVNNSEQFKEVDSMCNGENYISPDERVRYFKTSTEKKTTWNDDIPLPIKKFFVSENDMVLYVAPCMTVVADSTVDYIKKVLITIRKDISDEQCEIFLIAHDKDLGYEFPVLYKRDEVKIGRGTKGKIMGYDDSIQAFFAYQHERLKNVEIFRKGVCKRYCYDIYTDFISCLKDGISVDSCTRLKDFLTNIDNYEITTR